MRNNIYIRILYGIILIAGVLYLPWYIPFILGFLGVLYFENYLEFLAASFLADSLYGVEGSRVFGMPFFHTILGFALFLVYELIKNRLRIKR